MRKKKKDELSGRNATGVSLFFHSYQVISEID